MNSSYHQNNRNYYNNSLKRDNFWSRHSLVVAIDASEIFDRVFCQCGLITVFQVWQVYCSWPRKSLIDRWYFQEAFTLTALDKRCFAPPIEDHWGRFVNMANTCESFKISARTVADLNNSGFKSVTLLSMARPRNLSNDITHDLASFKKCLRTLNDRRVTVLEPLHSLRRLAQAKRKHLHNVTKWEYLDLAGLSKRKLPPNRDYKVISKLALNQFLFQNSLNFSNHNQWLPRPLSTFMIPWKYLDRINLAIANLWGHPCLPPLHLLRGIQVSDRPWQTFRIHQIPLSSPWRLTKMAIFHRLL